MCGLAGELRFDGAPVDTQALERMTTPTAARPDSFGLFVPPEQGFGHRRLKIMDLSDAAQQPMVDPLLGWVWYSMAPFTTMVNCAKNCKPRDIPFIRRAIPGSPAQAYHAWGETLCGAAQWHVCLRPVGARFRPCFAGP